jgi:RHS repeat-associated protein
MNSPYSSFEPKTSDDEASKTGLAVKRLALARLSCFESAIDSSTFCSNNAMAHPKHARRTIALLFRSSCALLILLLLTFSHAGAQVAKNTTAAMTPQGMKPGSPAGAYALSGFDTINLFNGNLNFRMPLLKIGGRGSAGYTMMLAVSTKKWQVRNEPGLDTNGDGGPGIADKFTPEWKQWNTLNVGYGPGVMQGRKTGSGTYVKKTCDTCPVLCQRREALHMYSLTRLTFISPDGTETEFRDEASNGKPMLVEQARCSDISDRGALREKRFISTDGSAMTFVSDEDIYDDVVQRSSGSTLFEPSGVLYLRDGTRYRIDVGMVSWIQDRNGNQMTFGAQGAASVITDSLGRRVTIEYNLTEEPYGLHDRITFRGFGGAWRVIRISKTSLSNALRAPYALQTYAQLFPDLNGSGNIRNPDGTPANFNPTVPLTIWLPDGRSYKISYNSYAEVARVELPTGGAFEYDMVPGSGVVAAFVNSSSGGSTQRQVYRRVRERRSYRGLTPDTLSGRDVYLEVSGGDVKVEQYDGAGQLLALSDHHFSGSARESLFSPLEGSLYSPAGEGKEVVTDSLDNTDTTKVLRRITNAWQQRESVAWVGHLETRFPNNNPPEGLAIEPENDPRLTGVKTTLETNQVTQREFAYDRYNNQTEVKEYDYGAGTQGALLRRTVNEYLKINPVNGVDYIGSGSDIHLRGLLLKKFIYAGESTTPIAQTEYEYDNYANDGNHAALLGRGSISGMGTASAYRGNLTRTSNWLSTGNTWLNEYMQYDVAGNVVKLIDPREKTTTIDYADRFGVPDGEAQSNISSTELGQLGQWSYAFPTGLTNALGHTIYAQYDYYLGRVVDGEDSNGVVASVHYDDLLDRPTQLVRAANRAALRNQTTIRYDDAARVITVTSDRNVYGDNLLKSAALFDGLGRTIENRQYETDADYVATNHLYDGLSRVSQASNPYRPWQGESPVWTSTEYDALGRTKFVTSPDGAKASSDYVGNKVTFKDQAGKQRQSELDALGRLVRVVEAPDVAGYAYQTVYAYDALGNLRQVTQGGQTRSFEYDSLSRLLSAFNPESGLTRYQYDANGNLSQKTDARLVITTAVYDNLNRITNRTYSDGTPAVTYTYDAIANAVGRLTSVRSSVSSSSYDEFDALGRVKRSTQTTSGNSYSFPNYEYDLAGNITSQTYPSGRVVTTAYDSAGRIGGVSGQQPGQAAPKPYASNLSYTAHGAVREMQLGNNLWEHTFFNNRLQPQMIGLGTSQAVVNPQDINRFRVDYYYGTTDNNGNVLQQTVSAFPDAAGNYGLSLRQVYSYDALNRLKSAEETSGWKQTFSYDAYGNRTFDTTNTTAGMVSSNLAIDPATNRYSTPQGYILYDPAGNLTRDFDGHTYGYDGENKQTSFDGGASASVGASYSYDGDGRRVKKTNGGSLETTVFVYNAAGQLVAEYTSSSQQTNGGTSYLTVDSLGSTRIITDADGGVKARHDYLPFGEELFAGRSQIAEYKVDNVRQKFTGQERDYESGLDFFQARYYSSTQGRFMSIDPLAASAVPENPQTWNRYAYVLNNPLRLVDPTGMTSQDKSRCPEPDKKQNEPIPLPQRVNDMIDRSFGPGMRETGNGKDHVIIQDSKKARGVITRAATGVCQTAFKIAADNVGLDNNGMSPQTTQSETTTSNTTSGASGSTTLEPGSPPSGTLETSSTQSTNGTSVTESNPIAARYAALDSSIVQMTPGIATEVLNTPITIRFEGTSITTGQVFERSSTERAISTILGEARTACSVRAYELAPPR